MKRISKTVYIDDKGRELVTIKDGKALIERAYSACTADELDELASAASAAAEELRNLAAAEMAS